MNDGPTHWLYPTNEQSKYYLLPGGHDNRVSPKNVWADIERDPTAADAWYLSTGFRQMRQGDAIWLYAAGEQTIYALARVASVYADEHRDHHADLVWNLSATRSLRRAPIPRSAFGVVPQSVRRADRATIDVLKRWLAAHGESVGDWNDPDAELSKDDARRRVRAEIVRRQGQQSFRNQLLAIYGRQCAITGESAECVLEAAHIWPYRGPKSNIPTNGILLRSDLHTLFDLWMIGVDGTDRVVVSTTLRGTSYWRLRGRAVRLPNGRERPSKRLLEEHCREVHSRAAITGPAGS